MPERCTWPTSTERSSARRFSAVSNHAEFIMPLDLDASGGISWRMRSKVETNCVGSGLDYVANA